jgi:hypothetical protein
VREETEETHLPSHAAPRPPKGQEQLQDGRDGSRLPAYGARPGVTGAVYLVRRNAPHRTVSSGLCAFSADARHWDREVSGTTPQRRVAVVLFAPPSGRGQGAAASHPAPILVGVW